MHYEDLEIKALRQEDEYWSATLMSSNCGMFVYPVADSSLTIKELEENGVFVGRKLLGVVKDDSLIGISEFEYIASNTKKR